MPYYKGVGRGERGETLEQIVEASNKYEAMGKLKELMPGGLTVLMQAPKPPEPVAGDDPGDSND